MPEPLTNAERAEIRRLRNEHRMTVEAISEATGRSVSAIKRYLTKAIREGLSEPLHKKDYGGGWTEARVEELTTLWLSGMPTGEIAHRLRISKNSVISKVHRLKLPGRGSPIKRGVTPKRPRRSRDRVPALPVPTAEIICMPHVPEPPKPAETSFRAPAPMRKPERHCDSGTGCRWIHGDPRDAHYCDKPTVPGRSWCEEHMQRVVLVRTVAGGTRPWRPEDEARLRRREAAA